MKVYFVGGKYLGCYYVRCHLPAMYNGWKGNYWGLNSNKLKDPILVAKEIREADIVVFHRADTNWHHRVGIELKKLGKKIVFDNDDTYKLSNFHPFFNLDERGFEQNKEKLNNIVNNFIFNSDLVTTTTNYLADEYREINKNVVVLPNYVDPDDWDEPLKNNTKQVRIGVVGSVAYHHDFGYIKNVIKELYSNKNIKIVLFGLWTETKRKENSLIEKTFKNEYSFWDSLTDVEHLQWVEMDEYFDALNQLRLDMMIIPRRENSFNKAKSNIKFLEASMLQIPVIAQSFSDNSSPYDKDIDGTNGILVKDFSENSWYQAIMDLVKDKDKRIEIGKNAYNYVVKNYNIKNHFKEWYNAYEKLYN